MSKVRLIYNKLLDFIYPKKCILCKEVFPVNADEKGVCEKCLPFFDMPLDKNCIICGRPTKRQYCNVCDGYKNGDFHEDKTVYYVKNYPVFIYNEVTKTPILSLKYNGALQNTEGFKIIIRNRLKTLDLHQIDGIIPIPMHKKKEKKRGFNQAYIIAEIVSKEIGKDIFNDVIIRNKNTTVQSDKSITDRYKNLENCFVCIDKDKIYGKTVLLIDDIFTSGSTINNTAKELIKNGAKEVYSLTLSITT